MSAAEGASLGREALTLVTYLAAAVLFIFGLKGLTRADAARPAFLHR